MSSPAHVHTVHCTENNCRLPVGRITDGKLVIMAKHHGEKHFVTIPIIDLLRLISANIDTNLLTAREKSSILAAEGRVVTP